MEISTWGSHLLGEPEARLSVPIRGRPLETVWFSVLLLRTVGRPPVLTWRDLVLLTDTCTAGSERWDDTRNESEPDLLGTLLRLDLILSNISILDLENSTGQVSCSPIRETNQSNTKHLTAKTFSIKPIYVQLKILTLISVICRSIQESPLIAHLVLG